MSSIITHFKNVSTLQENYWRIPNTLSQVQLRELCEMIECAINGTLNINRDTLENTAEILTSIEDTTNRNEESSDDDDLFDKLRRLRTGNVDEIPSQSTSVKGNVMQATASSSQSSDTGHENVDGDISTQEITSFRRALLSEGDDSDGIVSNIDENGSESAYPSSVASSRYKKRIRQIVSNDSDDSEKENVAQDDETPVAEQAATLMSDSDGETTKSTKRRRILDSDDDA